MKKQLAAGKGRRIVLWLMILALWAGGCERAGTPGEGVGTEMNAVMPEEPQVNMEPEVRYVITRPGTLRAKDYVEVSEKTDASAGFVSFARRQDLIVMTDEELELDAAERSGEISCGGDLEFLESVEAAKDGIYDGQIGIEDADGKVRILSFIFYVDGTAPEITGLEEQQITVENPAQEFSIDTDRLQIYDAFDGDLLEAESSKLRITSNGDGAWKENGYTETFTATVTAADRAGNIGERSVRILAYWDGAKAADVPAAPIRAAAPDGIDREKAEEAFALVNGLRSANGLPALAWNEGLYELACVRAQEIVQKFSHERPDGTWITESLYEAGCLEGNGENLSRYGATAAETVDSWMNSPSHRDNILEPRFTQGVMACYCLDGSYYWVNLFQA